MERARRSWGPIAGLLIVLAGALAAVWLSARQPGSATERPGARDRAAETPSAAAEPEASEAAEPARDAVEPEPAGMRDVALILERFPDRAPIAHAVLEVEPSAADGQAWPATDSAGRARVRVPSAARALLVRVSGFEPGEGALVPGNGELRLALVPSSGLFGRVLRADGSPASVAEVELVASRWRVNLAVDERYPKPQSTVQAWLRTTATTTTNAEGWYVLDRPTGSAEGTVEVRARLGELDGR